MVKSCNIENEKVTLSILWLHQKWKKQETVKTSLFSTVNKTKESMLLTFIFTKSFCNTSV